jgi:flagellar hook-length control protein FliK
MAMADGVEMSGKEGRAALDQKNSLPPGNTSTSSSSATLVAQNPELRIPPRSDNANAAILAGDSNPGNSGSTPAFATALAATGAANGTAAPTPPPAITSTINSPNWTQDFGSRVVWLAKNDQQVAQININPPQLGPIQITIYINGDQTSAAFASPHPEVRQAIQDSLPQLREMFSNAGISLGQANVGSQLPSQNRETPFQFGNEARSTGENAILSPDGHASSNPAGIPIQRGRGLVDLFA